MDSTTNPRRTLTWAVCLEGALVTRDRAREWPEGDALREAVLSWPDMPENGEAEYRGGPLRATELAAHLKMADPDETVQILVWEADD
jgi:hypothetical protein